MRGVIVRDDGTGPAEQRWGRWRGIQTGSRNWNSGRDC